MKIITINTHSYIEESYEEKLKIFVSEMKREMPDIIAMQEVNQKSENSITNSDFLVKGYGIPLKKDNYALRVAKILDCYKLIWVGIKRGYDVFDEGLAFLVNSDVEDTDAFYISKTHDINNWKTRMALGVKINSEWFYNVHMGRWDDEEEDFKSQWNVFARNFKHGERTWIMGDFNAPDSKVNEGYSLMTNSGWYDTYELAVCKDDGFTVTECIDGWREDNVNLMRIDYILSDKKTRILSSETIFKKECKVSDHYGIKIITE